MTARHKQIVKIAAIMHGTLALMVPLFLAVVYLTRNWGYFRLGECYFRLFFHVYCPGCGCTRALKAILSFRFADAFLLNPGFCLLILAIIWTDLWLLISIIKKDEKYLSLSPPHIYIVVASVALIWAVVRTILAYTTSFDPLGDLATVPNIYAEIADFFVRLFRRGG